jgi:hypothetical protein
MLPDSSTECLNSSQRQLNCDVAFCKDLLARNSMSSYITINMLLEDVVTFHCAKEPWILINSDISVRGHTPTLALTPPTSIMTTKQEKHPHQLSNCQIMILHLLQTVFYLHSFMNHIATLFFTHPAFFPAIQMLTPNLNVSI